MRAKILYHVRTPTAVTIDLLESRSVAEQLAARENHELYEIDTMTAIATKLRSAQTFKAREHDEDRRPVVTPAASRAEQRRRDGVSFSFSSELAEAS